MPRVTTSVVPRGLSAVPGDVIGATAGPSINDGQRRRSTMASGGQQWQTTGPPSEQWSSWVNSRVESGQRSGHGRVGLPRGPLRECHVALELKPQQMARRTRTHDLPVMNLSATTRTTMLEHSYNYSR
ncbi:hypothetical protein Tco_0191133 [Tanacetum coccineum]